MEMASGIKNENQRLSRVSDSLSEEMGFVRNEVAERKREVVGLQVEISELKQSVQDVKEQIHQPEPVEKTMQDLADSHSRQQFWMQSTHTTAPPSSHGLEAAFNYADNLNDLASMLRNVPVGSRISLSPQMAALALVEEATPAGELEEEQGEAGEVEEEQGEVAADESEAAAAAADESEAAAAADESEAAAAAADESEAAAAVGEIEEDQGAAAAAAVGGGQSETELPLKQEKEEDGLGEQPLILDDVEVVSTLPQPLIPKEVANRLVISQTCSFEDLGKAINRFGLDNLNRSSVPFLKNLCDYIHIPYASPKKEAVRHLMAWAMNQCSMPYSDSAAGTQSESV